MPKNILYWENLPYASTCKRLCIFSGERLISSRNDVIIHQQGIAIRKGVTGI